MNRQPDFLASECRLTGPEARFHVLPVPLESTVSYGGGTAAGPAAILEASQQLEDWDGRSCPLDEGIHTLPAIDCRGQIEEVLTRIERAVAAVLRAGRLPVLLGGEHTVTLGSLRALAQGLPKGAIGLIQIDAHADLRESYEGSIYSHACVARRALEDLGMPIFQFGVRALSAVEARLRNQDARISFLDAATFAHNGLPAELLPADFPNTVYLSFDVDGLDPSVIRATGTPVPGGPGWHDCLRFVEQALRGRRVAGFDVVELAPQPDDHASSFAAAQLVYSIMGIVQRN
ncbi:MAG: agmatinase [Desulfobulbaceae bacterium]|nr:agmatinase [Desulfobulbaceae bacterium]